MSKPARTSPSFAALVQAYFAEYLTQQRALSPQTIAAYRDALVLFLEFDLSFSSIFGSNSMNFLIAID